MFSHTMLGTHDLDRARAFYDAMLAPLGITPLAGRWDGSAAWQRVGETGKFWVGMPQNGLPASWGNGVMVAFAAPSRAAVDAAHAAALAMGGFDEGAPGVRPDYAADYYGAYARDPDGNNIHFVFRGPG